MHDSSNSDRRPPICTPRPLPLERQLEAARVAQRIFPANVPEGLDLDSPRIAGDRLALAVSRYWGKEPRILTVKFLDARSVDLRQRILSHLNAWTRTTCIKFVESATDPQVRIARYTAKQAPGFEGYWSYVGTEILTIPPDEPTMNLEGFTMKTAESEFRRVVRHEAGHTLGFEHEHMRRSIIERLDRKKTIRYFMDTQGWTEQDVLDQVLTPLEESSLLGTAAAEETSIMCYEAPAEITRDGAAIPGGVDITRSDYAFAGAVYPKPTRPGKKKKEEGPRGEGPEAPEQAPRFHVLLIGIDAYAGMPLAGCVNDIDVVQELLIRRLGVQPASIRRLAAPRDGTEHPTEVQSEPPTRENVIAALERLAGEEVGAGDRVFIYYSGHGTMVTCRGADGGLFTREALVPVDHRHFASKLLFDWEVNRLIAQIAAHTPAVTCVLDCCNSQGAARELTEEEKEEGTQDRFYVETAIIDVAADSEPASERDQGRGLVAGLAANAGAAVVVAACLADERARESVGPDGRRHGELTRALLAALQPVADELLPDLRWGGIWRGLVAGVVARNAAQHPWISSAEVRRVFGGPPEEGDLGYAIRAEGNAYKLDVGTLSGVTVGAEIGVYPSAPARFPRLESSSDRALRIGVVRVTVAEPASATAVAVSPTPFPALPEGARGRLVKAGEAARLRVSLASPDTESPERAAWAELATRIGASGLLTVVARGEASDVTVMRRTDGAYALTDQVFGAGEKPDEPSIPPIPADDPDGVVALLEHYSRYVTPLRLARQCQDFSGGLTVRLLACPPGETPPDVAQDPPFPELRPAQGASYELRAAAGSETRFCVRVENTTGVKLYVSLLDCADSGKVVPLSTREVIPAGARKVFWNGALGAAFKAWLEAGRTVAIDRVVVVGTTDPNATLDHLALSDTFEGVLRGSLTGKDFKDFAEERTSRWTATVTTVRTTVEGAGAVAPVPGPAAPVPGPAAPVAGAPAKPARVQSGGRRGVVLLDVPASLEVQIVTGQPEAAGATRGGGAVLAADDDFVRHALVGEGFELVDELAIAPKAASRGGMRGGEDEVVSFEVPVDAEAGEGTAALIEQDGVVRWVFPQDEARAIRPMFAISLAEAPAGASRGWPLAGLRVRVFRFLARQAVRLFERRRREGLVHLTSALPNGWLPVEPKEIEHDGPVLLLIHGTFSSTLGCFGALALEGARGFLERALAEKFLVIGYDHPTLGATPLDNARKMFAALRAARLLERPIQVVCHSRGGLVARCVAQLIAAHRGRPVEQVLCVATTDDGTRMAAPENWRQLADVLTNLTRAAATVWSIVGGGAIAGPVVAAALGGVFALIQELALGVLDERSVPGLAAMTAGGTFLQGLAGWSPAVVADRRALLSNFSASGQERGAVGDAASQAVFWVADAIADRLFGQEPNDLVVENRSTQLALGIDRVERIPAGSRIHHVNFFGAEETARWLSRHVFGPRSRRAMERGVGASGARGLSEAVGAAPGAAGTTARTDLYIQTCAPEVVRPREAFWVAVELSRESPGPQAMHEAVEADDVVEVELVARENAVVRRTARVSVKAPGPGAVVRVSLEAEALAPGLARLRAVVQQRGRVVSVDVDTAVEREAGTAGKGVDASAALADIGALETVMARLHDRLAADWKRAGRDPQQLDRTLRSLGALLLRELFPEAP